MNDFEREAIRQERWRRHMEALDEAVESPGLYHCPVCFHSWQAPGEDEDEDGWSPYDWKGPWCLACAIDGRVSKMGEAEGFPGEWYDQYLPPAPPLRPWSAPFQEALF